MIVLIRFVDWGLKQEDIFKEHFYLYTDPCDLIDKENRMA